MKPLQITCNKIRQKIIPFWYLFRISTVVMGLRLVGFVSAAALALLGVLSLDTSWTTATEWWSEGEVNVFLRVKSDNVWWDIDNLKRYFTKCPISYCRSKYRFILSFWWELIVSSYRNKSALHKSASSSFVRNSLNINQSEWSIQETISVRTVVNLTCFLTRMCLCLIRTRAWWIDLASPSLKTIIG